MFELLGENIRIAIESIRTQLLRTILTILIIAFGVFALVGILSFIKSFESTVTGDFASMGSNTFTLQRYNFDLQFSGERDRVHPVISYRDIKQFEENYQFPTAGVGVSFTGTVTAEVKSENLKTDPEVQIVGVNENFIINSGLEITNGRE